MTQIYILCLIGALLGSSFIMSLKDKNYFYTAIFAIVIILLGFIIV